MAIDFEHALDDLVLEWTKRGCTWDEIISDLELAIGKAEDARNAEEGI